MDTDADRLERDRERDGWVVDRATGRVVRRGSATLAAKVKDALVEAMTEGALSLDPGESDARAVLPAEPPVEVAEPIAARPKRPPEAHVMPDARELGRERRGF
ncbi:MAG: hypothetical protein C0506_03130 [Anaerolinea sp.]|nr:hypothetical protein [Anaerolinea sp.]